MHVSFYNYTVDELYIMDNVIKTVTPLTQQVYKLKY